MIGLVENMAGYACPHCGEISDPFGIGGAEAAATAMGMPFLGRIPLAIGDPRGVGRGHAPGRRRRAEAAAFPAIARAREGVDRRAVIRAMG